MTQGSCGYGPVRVKRDPRLVDCELSENRTAVGLALRSSALEGSLALRIWISCVRAQFAAILVEKNAHFRQK